MKLRLLSLTLIITTNLLATQPDTFFLKRVVTDTPYKIYHAIFIDTGMSFKTRLLNFNFSNYDSATYFGELKAMPYLPGIKTSIKEFPKKWIALYQWKGKYYLYHPSDFGNHYRFEITDSTSIDFTMEGPEPSRLINVTMPSPSKVIITRKNLWDGQHLEIKMIDKRKGIAVFTFGPTKFNNTPHRVLMVDAMKAHLYSIIVNYCATDKQSEFDFDKVNFKSLLN